MVPRPSRLMPSQRITSSGLNVASTRWIWQPVASASGSKLLSRARQQAIKTYLHHGLRVSHAAKRASWRRKRIDSTGR